MLLTPHALVGGAIGASSENIAFVFIVAFLSHFVLDALPHTDWGTWHNYVEDVKLKWYDYLLFIIDSLTTLVIAVILYLRGYDFIIIIAEFTAVIVDLIDNVPFWKNQLRKIFLLNWLHVVHEKIHFKLNKRFWYWGIITQLIIVWFGIVIIFK